MQRSFFALIALVALCCLLAGCAAAGPTRVGALPTPLPDHAGLARWVAPVEQRVMAGTVLSAVSAASVPTPAPPAPVGVPCAGFTQGGPVVPLCRAGTSGGPADAVVTQIPGTNLRVNQAWADTISRFRAEGRAAGFDLQGAKMQGLDLGSHRSAADQQELVDKGFPAAPPGKSMHEWGLAVDWSCNGKLFGDPANGACRRWVQANGPRHGLRVLGHEPWHWSTNGK